MKKVNYSVEIQQTSRELTAREKLALKMDSAMHRLDELVQPDSPLTIFPVTGFAVLEIHNESADNPVYNHFVIEQNGARYVTGSENFFDDFMEIWNTMKTDAPDEEFGIVVTKVESKNYKGKHFITCNIA